ncbi:MAG: hypothetical protein ABSA12_13295 [Verrucomicrobiia bacterium]|jgi:hypothetical protein
MNRRISYLAIAIGVAVTFVCQPALAKEGKPAGYMKVVSINLPDSKITISDATGKNPVTYALTPLTKVTLNGQPAKLRDLHRGMHVVLSVIQGGKTADKIDATDSSSGQK